VRLELFDIKGAKVRTAVNAIRNAGTYRERIATNGLAAGMYVVKLQAGNAVLRERVLVGR